MSLLQEYKTDFILLVESGFIAVNQSDEDAATKLFKAAELLDPANPLSQLGIGYIHLFKLELKQAANVFSELLAKHPDNEMARTLLGLSLSLNPQETVKGEQTLEKSITTSKDPTIKKLAESSLDFVQKFVKNSPTPPKAPQQKKK
jgi:tetratricopeptide (TPR) repeat protein